MEAQNTTKFKYLTAGEKGTVLVAALHGGPCYVFDIPKRTCLHKLNLRHFNSHSMYIGDVVFTNDDAYLVSEVKTRPEKAPEGSRDVYMPLCWDIQRNCIHKQLVDYEYYLKAINNGQNVSKVDAFQLLDNRTIASNHSDAVIRVFDLHTGEVKKRLEGHLNANFSIVKDGPFLMSHGIDIEDNVIKLIDRTTFETRATFSLDHEIQDLVFTEDGYHAVGYFSESKKPVLWSLMGGSEDDPARKAFKPLSSFPDIYGPDTVQLQLQLEMDTDKDEDPDDLDKDIDEV